MHLLSCSEGCKAPAGYCIVTVLLHTSPDLPSDKTPAFWVSLGDGPAALAHNKRRPDVSAQLEDAFDAIAARWFELAKDLAATPSAELAHAPACAVNASDFGLMLAWTRLVDAWAAEAETTLVICDDPWMFHHLARRPGIDAGRPPPLWSKAAGLWFRGFAARLKAAARYSLTCLRSRARRPNGSSGDSWLLVYAHPTSTADGEDGYFGDLMRTMPYLQRVLHVDCGWKRARELGRDGRTFSLHAWGNPLFALALLPFSKWRPNPAQKRGEAGWLVRRAAALEGGTGQAAAIRWQGHCQERWLAATGPGVVAWPWENHAWERSFVRATRAGKTITIGYQHSVIGRHMFNYAAVSNVDGAASLPDRVLCSGASTRDQLRAWGMDDGRLGIGGGFRFSQRGRTQFDPAAPVFVALPFDQATAAEMVATVRRIAGGKRRFLVKDHPMTPFAFDNSPGVERSRVPLGQHQRLSAVIFAATTVGLEAVLLGLPTVRFRPTGTFVIDILPRGVSVPVAGPDDLDAVLEGLVPPPAIDRETVLAKPDRALWASVLNPGGSTHAV